MAKLKSGWLEQHIASAEHDFRTWPRWMLDAAGIMDVEQTETERLAAAVVEKDVEIERLRELLFECEPWVRRCPACGKALKDRHYRPAAEHSDDCALAAAARRGAEMTDKAGE